MCSAPAASAGGGTGAAFVAGVAAAPGSAVLVEVSTSPCKLLAPAAMAVSRCCFVGGPGCAAPAELSEFCGWPRRMFMVEVTRCRLVGMPGCAALTLSKGRLPVHLATASCSALLASPASAAGCSSLLAGAPVWASRLARNLLASVMTACCNSVIKVANGRRRL